MESEKKQMIDTENVKIIEWKNFEQELSHLWSLSSSLDKANEMKISLQHKLESLIQVRAETLRRTNELEEMRQKLETRKLMMGKLLMRSKFVAEDVRHQEEQLSFSVRSLLVAVKSLSVAHKQLQEANRLLAGEKGHVHLKNSQKMLRKRIQYMVTQVSDIYPVNTSTVKTHGEKLDSSSFGTRSGDPVESKPDSPRSLTILGIQQISLPLKKAGFFSDKKEVQRSASALGYVSQAVSLIASYLDVPLRYPLHLGGSHSYITDYAPSIEPASTDSLSSQMFYTNLKSTEFPLFLEGQDTTRAAYAIFLLNKDLEQLMNFIGIQSLGPRHVLANLKELFRTIMSQEYLFNFMPVTGVLGAAREMRLDLHRIFFAYEAAQKHVPTSK